MNPTHPARRRAHYILSSHWDREWYQTFQDYRYRFVALFDALLDRLESGDLRGPFTCDGQAILLEDYLEIRPERENQVRKFLAQGKLVAGPWYVLPDEFLVSGESLVRNIRFGRELTRTFGGEPSRMGFACDLFGHCSQLPQILRQFGIKAAIVWRGLNPLAEARFWWVGADGISFPAIRFGDAGYCDYTYKVRHSQKPPIEFEPKRAAADLRAFLEEEAARTGGNGPFLVFDGGDHLEQDPDHYRVLMQAAEDPNQPYEIIHSSLDGFLEEMVASFGDVKKRIEGELREPGGRDPKDQQWVIPGVLSSRVWIKQANAACQNLLCQWAEPFSLMATKLVGAKKPETYLLRAWTWLLQNHPHDSICGCSIDQVHEDMKYRFSQCRQLAHRVTEEALTVIAAHVEGDLGERELRVTVFNPAPKDRNEVVELVLAIPRDWPEFNDFFGFETKPAFQIFGDDGRELPYQRLAQKKNSLCKRIRRIKYPEAYPVCEVTVALLLQLPATGYTTLRVVGDKRTEEDAKKSPFVSPTRHPATPGLAISDRVMENEHLRVTVKSNGSLALLDKRTGETYDHLLIFEDGADIGDGWYHGPAVNDSHFSTAASSAAVAVVANGPLMASLRARVTLRIPKAFDFESMRRSEELIDLEIDTTFTLRSGQNFVEIISRVKNTAKDHRLRALFPSGTEKAATFLADAPFDVVERPIALRADNHLLREMEVETKPQQSWTAIHDEKRGLAVICDGGQLETGVRDVPEHPILLTLFRSTAKTVMTTGEPGGQLLGNEMTFRHRLMPLAGPPDRAALFQCAQELSGNLKSVQLQAKDIGLRRKGSSIPPSSSLLRLEGEAVLTSLRQVGEGTEIRLFNPTLSSVEAVVVPGFCMGAVKAQTVDLESKPVNNGQTLAGATLRPKLAAKEILTLAVR